MPARRTPVVIGLLLASAATTADAVTIAHFVAQRLDNICAVDDSEPITAGDPDLRFRMIIRDPGTYNDVCPSGCVDDGNPATQDAKSVNRCGFVSTCGSWDFADIELTKVIPNASGAIFDFHLVDDDTDTDDFMGGWEKDTDVASSDTEWNNTVNHPFLSGPIVDILCGEAVDGVGWFDNYRLTYSISFTDTDGPNPMAKPFALQNGVPTSADYDQHLDLSWTPATDPNTGISKYRVNLLDATTGTYVFQNAASLFKEAASFSVCAHGCDYDYEPVIGHLYLFSVTATNGKHPGITNPSTATSPFGSVLVSDPLGVEGGPTSFSLLAPVPNPTEAGAVIAYSLPAAGPVRLEVMDLQGRRAILLADGGDVAGPHHITWNGLDQSGQRMKPGAYWLRLQFANAHKLQRLVVVR